MKHLRVSATLGNSNSFDCSRLHEPCIRIRKLTISAGSKTKTSDISTSKSYKVEITDHYSDGSVEASEIKVLKVTTQGPRNLKIGNMSNCRDMGGRTNANGGTIKQGLIYRTSDPATSGVGDVSEWTKRMGIKTEIYVKDGSNSSGPLGSTVKFVNASMD